MTNKKVVRGRKKKSKLQEEHEEGQNKVRERLTEIRPLIESQKGIELKDMILLGLALDAQVESLQDMFEVVVPDLFKVIN